MIKVRIIFDVVGWAYFHRARILQEYAPPDMEITIGSSRERWSNGGMDLLFDMNYGHTTEVSRQMSSWSSKPLFLVSFNNPARINEYFPTVRRDAHAIVINNRRAWEVAGSLAGTYHISNGVDHRVFRSIVPMRDRPLKMLWIGSDYHRGTKNYDSILVHLEKRLQGVVEADFRVTDPVGRIMTPAQMADWYNSGSVYVVASNTEGTPNPALEAASCGCALVTTRVGNMPELVRDGENGVFVEATSIDSVEAGVRQAIARREELSAQMANDIAAWDWRARAEEYYKLFRGLLSGELPLGRPR